MLATAMLAFVGNYMAGLLLRPEGMTVAEALNMINDYMLALSIDGHTFIGNVHLWLFLGGILGSITYLVVSLKGRKANH